MNDINITVTEQKKHIGKYNITLSPKDNKNHCSITISGYETTWGAHTLKQKILRTKNFPIGHNSPVINFYEKYELLRNLAYNKADSIKNEIDNQIIEKGFEAAGLSKALSSQEVDDKIFTEAGFSKVLSRQEVDAKIEEEKQVHLQHSPQTIRDILADIKAISAQTTKSNETR
jgi:hypothetical protein